MKLEDLFIGPLGKAQLSAIKFTNGMIQAQAILEILERVEILDNLLATRELEEVEKKVAEQLREELYNTVISLSEGEPEDGKAAEKKIL